MTSGSHNRPSELKDCVLWLDIDPDHAGSRRNNMQLAIGKFSNSIQKVIENEDEGLLDEICQVAAEQVAKLVDSNDKFHLFSKNWNQIVENSTEGRDDIRKKLKNVLWSAT